MNSFEPLSQILGTCRKNPSFSVYLNAKDNQLHVYYGMELFEVVPNEREDMRFKIMIAHMVNIGMPVVKIIDVFPIDRKTIRIWANALKSGSAEEMMNVFEGRGKARKLTKAVEQFARIRFGQIFPVNKKTYSSMIRKEIKDYFDTDICGETIRPLFTQLRREYDDSFKKKTSH